MLQRIPGRLRHYRASELAGSGAAGLSDTDRQNILLSRIYQSKAIGDYRRFLSAFATGFKASTDTLRGIATGSSSNYDTTNAAASGYVLPSVTATAISQATGTNIGNMTAAGGLAAAFDGTTTQAHTAAAKMTGGTGATGYVGKNYTGAAKAIANARVYATDGTGTVHWNTGSNSDTITLTLYGKASAPASATDGTVLGSTSFANGPSGTAAATTPSPTITSSDTTTTWNYVWVAISTNAGTGGVVVAEVVFSTPVTDNMTLVTTAQTADASVSSARVLMEINNAIAATLNTDLTVEVTCNGGTNWATCTLSLLSSNGQAGRHVVETGATTCTAGTSFAARIKTLNNKSVPIYGVSLSVSS